MSSLTIKFIGKGFIVIKQLSQMGPFSPLLFDKPVYECERLRNGNLVVPRYMTPIKVFILITLQALNMRVMWDLNPRPSGVFGKAIEGN